MIERERLRSAKEVIAGSAFNLGRGLGASFDFLQVSRRIVHRLHWGDLFRLLILSGGFGAQLCWFSIGLYFHVEPL
jgi:hypothetical protein